MTLIHTVTHTNQGLKSTQGLEIDSSFYDKNVVISVLVISIFI